MPGIGQKNRRRRSTKQRLGSIKELGKRAAGKILPFTLLAVVAVGIPYGAFAAYLHVVSSPYFSLEQIEVEGAEHVTKESLLGRAEIELGMNIFDVDVERVKTLVESEPWVESARVERRLPDRLTVDVSEHEPAAVLVVGSTWHLIDGRGETFKALEPTDPVDTVLALPFVTGLEPNEAQNPASRELVVEALELVHVYNRMGLAADYPLSEVHVDRVMGLSLVPTNGMEIRLGRGRYEERLKRLGVVLATLEGEGRGADYLLIDQEEDLSRVTVGQRSRGMDASNALHN